LDEAQIEEAGKPFDLGAGPIIRARLIQLGTNHHVLMITVHHLVCDGYSFGILLRELGEIYSAHCQNLPGALPDALQFSDYASAQVQGQESPAHARDEKYWMDQFATVAPVLDMPVDHPRSTVVKFDGAREG